MAIKLNRNVFQKNQLKAGGPLEGSEPLYEQRSKEGKLELNEMKSISSFG